MLEFRLLGPLEARYEGRAVAIRSARQRAILAAVLLEPRTVFSSDRLLDAVWGEELPGSGPRALRFHVSKLRSAFRAAGSELPLVTSRSGYMLDVPVDAVDSARFERLVARARNDSEPGTHARLRLLDEALGLWRGRVLAGPEEYLEFAQGEIRRLEELRVGAELDRAALQLDAGDVDTVLALARRLREAHPWNERVCELLMLALYRSGRQSDALSAYREYASGLIEARGLDPGAGLQDLEQRIIAQDPSLMVSVSQPSLPRGTVTFLSTDIVGSTGRWASDAGAMQDLLGRHDRAVSHAVNDEGGSVFKRTGDGILAAFAEPTGAVDAAVAAMVHLGTTSGEGPPLRMAIHTGPAEPHGDDYVGLTVSRCARLGSIGHAGQILVSETAATLISDRVQLLDLGQHRLRDLTRAERVYQVLAPGLASSHAPLRSVDAFPNNLPAFPTSFLGRKAEVEELSALLDANRLVTLTGPPGSGKTRLALRLAADRTRVGPDGAWLVRLASIDAPEAVASQIAAELGVHEQHDLDPVDAMLGYLADKQMMVVMDNCEHVIDIAAELVHRIVGACPDVSVLCTSRVPLDVDGEVAWPVPPLPTRAASGPSDAEVLFVDRATMARGGRPPEPAELEHIGRICRAVDGIPLAIELAAARAGSMSIDGISARLEADTLAMLGGRGRDRTRRQQTLEAALAWTHGLLEPEEQRLFARLAVFHGGFTLDAVEHLEAAEPAIAAFDRLDQLRAKSMIVADPTASRFSMLQIIRAFAEPRLEAMADTAAVQAAHADYYGRLAVVGGRGLHLDPTWVDRLRSDLDNLRAAFSWILGSETPQRALKAISWLDNFWLWIGKAREGLEWTERALGHANAVADLEVARALQSAGFLASIDRQYGRSREFLEAAMRAYDGEPRGIAWSEFHLARALSAKAFSGGPIEGDLEESRLLFSSAEAAFRKAMTGDGDDERAVVEGLFGLAIVLPFAAWNHALAGDTAAAISAAEECIQIADGAGLARAGGMGRANLAIALNREFRHADAIDPLVEADDTFQAIDDLYSLQIVVSLRGITELAMGDVAAAVQSVRRGLRVMRVQGAREWESLTGGLAAAVLAETDGREEAATVATWLDAVNPGWRALLARAGYQAAEDLPAAAATAALAEPAATFARRVLELLPEEAVKTPGGPRSSPRPGRAE